MLNILLTLVIGVLLNAANVFGYLPGYIGNAIELNSKDYGASCSPIKYTPNSKMQASIELHIDQLDSKDRSTLKDLKIPVLIFRYADILNFTSIRPIEDYFYDYSYYFSEGSLDDQKEFYKDVVDFKQNKFKLDMSNGYKLNKDRIYNDYLTIDSKDEKHIKAVLPVYESGIYCAYVAPPVDSGIKKLSIPVNYKNSYGYLPYIQYAIYTQYKYIVTIGLLLTAYLFHYILKFKVGKDFKNMNSISIISKAVIFYLLIPIVFLSIGDWFIDFIQNNYISSGSHATIFKFLKMTITWMDYNFSIMLRFFILLFAMGYGVIYYHNNANQNYREMPARLINKAIVLFVVNVCLFSVRECLDYFGDSIVSAMYGDTFSNGMQKINPHFDPSAIFIVHQIINFACEVFPLIWFVLSLVHYFKTKKTIAKFPPISATAEGSVDANSRIIKSFRQSILILFVLPVFLAFVFGTFVAYHIIHSNEYSLDIPNTTGREDIAQLVLSMRMLEILTFDNSAILPAVWVSVLNVYLTIVLIYAIWIRNDNELVMEAYSREFSSTGSMNLEYESDSY